MAPMLTRGMPGRQVASQLMGLRKVRRQFYTRENIIRNAAFVGIGQITHGAVTIFSASPAFKKSLAGFCSTVRNFLTAL